MTETTSETGPRTELRMARGVLSNLRQDLFTHAFAFRPLPPVDARGRLAGRLPERFREYVRWTPHVALCVWAVLLILVSVSDGAAPPPLALLATLPVFLTLFRPVGAWWLSVAASVIGMALDSGDHQIALWTPAGFLAHVTVVAVVALRTRPRVALEMWAITAFLAGASGREEAFGIAFFLGLLLLAVTAARGWRQSREQVVVQTAVTEAERSRRTLLEERTTIARELHDVVAHHMSVVAIQAEAAPYRVQDPPEELVKSFGVIRENAVSALTELRRVLGVIRTDDPDSPLADAPEAPQPTLASLDTLLANVRASGVEVGKVVTGSVRPLPSGVELSAYRIVQEALSNTLRHAPGADAVVELGYVPVGLGLRIVNGPADALAKASPGAGHGILGMRERAAMLGGDVTARPTEDGGYEVVAFLPVDPVEPVEPAGGAS